MPETFQTVTARVRAFLDENEDPIVWTDANLIAPADEALEDLSIDLAIAGVPLEEDDATITIPAATTELTYTSVPALPAGLLIPHTLEEREVGSVDQWVPMTKRTRTFSSVTQDASLGEWMWRKGRIRFIGATAQRSVRIVYVRKLTSFSELAPDDPLEIPHSANALAWRIVANSEYSRGEMALMARAELRYEQAKWKLLQLAVKEQQGNLYIRPAYGEPA